MKKSKGYRDELANAIASELQERLPALRHSRGLSSEQLADEAGLSRSAVTCIEAGLTGASLTTVAAFAVALGQSVDSLIGTERLRRIARAGRRVRKRA